MNPIALTLAVAISFSWVGSQRADAALVADDECSQTSTTQTDLQAGIYQGVSETCGDDPDDNHDEGDDVSENCSQNHDAAQTEAPTGLTQADMQTSAYQVVSESCGTGNPEYDWVTICDGISQRHTCSTPVKCWGTESEGILQQAYLDGVIQNTVTRCLVDSDSGPNITPTFVASVAWKLTWPESALILDPVSGRNFVNKENIFHTTNTSPSTQVVRAFGHRITIEATPAEYEWLFGDGTSTVTTDPGRPYPARDITHVYLTKGTFSPSVSTTYRGRYRVDNAAWQSIPTTLTLPGPSVPLEIVTARPTLVS